MLDRTYSLALYRAT